MRKRWVWGLICLLLCLLPACGQEKPAANDVPPASESPVEAAPQKREADFSAAFGGIQGCAVLYDPGTDQWTFYQEEMCRQRVSPCSTFKIVSTLMGLHTGVLSGPESTMTYSGLTYPVAAWNQNLTLEQAFQSSCVWYFRQVIDQVGRQAVAERLLDGLSALTLLSCLIIAAVLLLWFLLRKKPLSEAAGLRHCSGWTVGFCAFGAVGLYVLVSLVLALLPESWMEEYGKAMRLSTETGLIPALAVVAGAPLAEELVFRGVIQSRLERAMPVWIAIVLQAVLFGFIHGTPVQIGYAFLMGLLFGYIRYRTGSILPTIAAHAAFNAMNDPLGLLGGFAEKWQFLAVMAAVCAAGCVLCRRGLSGLRTAPEAEARPTSPTVCEEITE